jgi:hypothetical protein
MGAHRMGRGSTTAKSTTTSKRAADVVMYRRLLCLLCPCSVYWACGHWCGRGIRVGHPISREAPRKSIHYLVWHTLNTRRS